MQRVLIPRFRSIHHLVVLVVLAWILTFIYHERYAPHHAASRCTWPTTINKDHTASPPQSDTVPETRVLLVADPQLIDNHTYPGRNGLLLSLSQHTVDIYLKRNYRSLISNLKPHYVVYLGDLLDNGRDSTDKYFGQQHRRFQKIFQTPFPSYTQGTNLFLNTPGNHDVGFGNGVNLDARKRFAENFGTLNTVFSIADVDFISLDALSYSSDQQEIYSDSRTFIDSLGPKQKPRVLLSHVPLYREPAASCGPHRESSSFDVNGFGFQYKNTVAPDLSLDLLQKVNPDLIFSGDDHDHCDYTHDEVTGQSGREITVKSISMAMGIKYPAVQLLTLKNSDTFAYSTDICYLQTPYVNVGVYAFLAVFTGVVLLLWNIKQKSPRYSYSSILPMVDESKPSLNSRKISNFLKEQDQLDTTSTTNSESQTGPYSYYLHSSNFYSTKPSKANSRIAIFYNDLKYTIVVFVRKWNLFSFLKHSAFLGVFVISIYYFGFCLTA